MVDIKTKYWERLIELKKDLGWFGCGVLVALTGFCGWFYVTELIRYLENQFDFATGVTRTDKVVECSKKQEIGKWDQTNTQQHDEAKQ